MDEDDQKALSLIENLANLQPIKTWSLLVTIFGDMSRASNPKISGTFLKGVLDPVGVRPEAVRVALHRLRKDGWLRTEKVGRETSYGLSEFALLETQSAYQDVYRSDVKFSDGWSLAVLPPNDGGLDIGVNVGKQCWLVPNEQSGKLDDALVAQLTSSNITGWINDELVAPETLIISEKLTRSVREIRECIHRFRPSRATIMRFLILHHWRRMALREETWFHIWANEAGAMAECHQQVVSALEMLQCETELA